MDIALGIERTGMLLSQGLKELECILVIKRTWALVNGEWRMANGAWCEGIFHCGYGKEDQCLCR